MAVSSRAVRVWGSSSGPKGPGESDTLPTFGRLEDKHPDRDHLTKTADFESDGRRIRACRQDNLYFVARLERTLQAEVSKALEGPRPALLLSARTEGQSDMRHARKDRRPVEVSIKATAPIGHHKARDAVRDGEDRVETSVRK